MDKVALILGAGPNIGEAVARAFTGKGYKVALASRSSNPSDSTDRKLYISSDLSKSGDVLHAFEQTKQTFGIPSVVVYNGESPFHAYVSLRPSRFTVSASTLTPPDDPFALALEAFNRDLSVNVTSAFVAAQQAVAGFAQLAEASPKTFIYTGNILNVEIIPGFIDQGMGKAAGAHMVWAASAAYKDRGFK